MDFKKHLEAAWGLTLKYIAPLVISTLVMAVVSCVTIGILAPVTMAGYLQSVLLMLREGREPKVGDLFSHFNLFFPLLGFGILVFIAVFIATLMLVLPGIILSLAIAFACLYMLPLMTDKKLSLFDAIKESYRMATTGKVVDHIVVMLIFIGLCAIGGSVFIGWLFTQPLACVFLMSVYEERTAAASPTTAPSWK
jgi:hypothetical protein